jgi:hypothetical protein
MKMIHFHSSGRMAPGHTMLDMLSTVTVFTDPTINQDGPH